MKPYDYGGASYHTATCTYITPALQDFLPRRRQGSSLIRRKITLSIKVRLMTRGAVDLIPFATLVSIALTV